MSDRNTGSTPSHIPNCLALASREHEGGVVEGQQPAVDPAPDLNALLAQEQTAIMTAEATSDVEVRGEQREIAWQARGQVDLTPFPSREPHDFERPSPAAQSGRSRGMEQVVGESMRSSNRSSQWRRRWVLGTPKEEWERSITLMSTAAA